MPEYGLIGYPLTHSFSKAYFESKFEKENLTGFSYRLFPLKDLNEFPAFIENHKDLNGFNVTIPHKKAIIKFMDELDTTAYEAGAVNTVKISSLHGKKRLVGYNTDVLGFRESLLSFIGKDKLNALILGTGGASAAVACVLKGLGIPYLFVSRTPKEVDDEIGYHQLNADILESHKLIINTTPLGMFPETALFPPIPYNYLTTSHFLFDLVYNPDKTTFLKKGMEIGCHIQNGLRMLHLQAEEAFSIWKADL